MITSQELGFFDTCGYRPSRPTQWRVSADKAGVRKAVAWRTSPAFKSAFGKDLNNVLNFVEFALANKAR